MVDSEKPAIIEAVENTFLTLPGEKLLVFSRRHELILLQSLFLIGFIFSLFFIVGLFLFTYIYPLFLFAFILSLIFLGAALTFTSKSIAEWYFHFYIVTTKKIAEVCYEPLGENYVYEILLDRVKCTEVDVKRCGFIGHAFDIGSISITFDRPTHQEEFLFTNIKHSSDIARLLIEQFIEVTNKEIGTNAIWSRRPNAANKKYFITDDTVPRIIGL